MSKKIITTINKKTGELSVKTEGYNGAECLEGAAAQLEAGLGMTKEGACELTPEYFTTNEENKDQISGS